MRTRRSAKISSGTSSTSRAFLFWHALTLRVFKTGARDFCFEDTAKTILMSTVEVKLRPYNRQDLPLLFAVEALCFAPPFRFSQQMLRALAEGESSFTWIAEDADQMAGFAIVQLEMSEGLLYGYLQTIDVAPEYRSRGVASRLLECVENQIIQAGALAMMLHVSIQNNAAISLYQHHGYSRLAIEERFYCNEKGDAFLYEKILACRTVHPS